MIMELLSSLLFIEIRWNHIVDILLVAVLIYQLYNLTRGTVAIKIFIGIISIYLIWKLVVALQMEMLGEILGQFIGVGVIALLIVFQQELRRFLLMIGNTRLLRNNEGGKVSFLGRLFGQETEIKTDVEALITACKHMADSKTGALIVVARKSDPLLYCNNAEELDAKVSSRLIESIFFKNSPLHDGAIVIDGDRVKAVRAVLPVTQNPNFPSELGMRHRSAVGITESTDALSIIVSEQTGSISTAFEGQLHKNIGAMELRRRLYEHVSDQQGTLEKEVQTPKESPATS